MAMHTPASTICHSDECSPWKLSSPTGRVRSAGVLMKTRAKGNSFQIQAAWMRRDLDKLRPLLTGEMLESFGKQIEAARAKRQVNKLENITIRSVELTEVWQEQGNDYATVRLLANLLDYTVDETTSRVMDGSDTVPVKFEEYWTWVRPVGPNSWRLSAINQAE